MTKRRASIKETGEELSPADWERFDAGVAAAKAERGRRADAPGSDGARDEDEGAECGRAEAAARMP